MTYLLPSRVDPRRSAPWMVAAIGGSLLSGALVPVAPALAAAPMAVVAATALIVSPLARVVVVVFGGLFVLEASQTLDPPKLAYLGAAAVAFGAALPNALREARRSGRPTQGLLMAGAAIGILALISFPVSLARGDDLLTWLRGVAPYALFAATPVFALDSAARVPRRWLAALLVVAGSVATASYAIQWITRRDLAELAVGHLGLASTLLPAALFAMALAMAVGAHRFRPMWAAFAGLVFIMMLLTGSRTNLVLLAALPAVFLAVRGGVWSRTARLGLTAAVLVGLSAAGLAFVTGLGGFAGEEVTDRLGSVGSVLANPVSDPSYFERAAQTAAAFEDWSEAPLLGTGPAHEVEWRDYGRTSRSTLVVDSPLLFPMRFGVLGLCVFLLVLLLWLRFIRTTGDAVARATLAGTWGVAIPYAAIGSPIDDKGFPIALLLGAAIALASRIGLSSDAQRPT